MKNRFGVSLLILSSILVVGYVQASTINVWQAIGVNSASRSGQPRMVLAPEKYTQFRLDEPLMRVQLAKAPRQEFGSNASMTSLTSIPVPLPTGEIVDLLVEETPIMEAELASKYPSIKTFVAHTSDQLPIYGRLDVTEQGFHAMFNTEHGVVMIDPRVDESGTRTYISYYKHDYHPAEKHPMICQTHGDAHDAGPNPFAFSTPGHSALISSARSGSELTTYRLAVAVTGEYTQYQGGTVGAALSAIVTTINRVNSIFERDMATRLQLVGNNNLIIYTSPSTDPYTNENGRAMLSQNQTNLDAVIGSANYDIGHVFGTGKGGIAGLGVLCGASKSWGVTGSSQPIGDSFDVDYVAHEIGHQFGGDHTFNGTTGSCNGNRSGTTAWEPGSGTTVMAYAGICGSENLQPNSDSLFHAGSIAEIIRFVTTGGASCGIRTAINNSAPIANAGADYTIPANTPFVLTASASDANSGDMLTYAWDEMDLGTASTAEDFADEGTRPLFRSFIPSSSPLRYFPKIESLRNNLTEIGESLPTTSRSLKLRLTVRDQHGGVADDDVLLTVSASAGPFRVTAPNGSEGLQSSATVTWDVAATNSAPVNCLNVNISLSTDSGVSFSVTLLASTPNDGSASVSFPAGSSSTARLKIQCTNNIFFDISDNNFSYNNAGSTSYSLMVYSSGASSVPINASPVAYAGTTGYAKLPIASGTSITLTAPPIASGLTFSSWSGCDLSAGISCSVTMNSVKTVTANYSNIDAFPANGLVPAGWSVTSGANAGWTVASDDKYEGSFSLKSGAILDLQKAQIEVTRIFRAGTISFTRRVSSEVGLDFLRFYIDGVLQQQWSGEQAWATFTYPLTAGSHTLRWSYEKDISLASGNDASWIDAVVLPEVNLVSNPGFESGVIGWSQHSTGGFSLVANETNFPPHGGSWFGWLGRYNGGTDTLYNDVVIPSGASKAVLRFWYRVVTNESGAIPLDTVVIEIYNPANNAKLATLTTLSNMNASAEWIQSASYDLSAFKGQMIRLKFTAALGPSNSTSFFLDDVSLTMQSNSILPSIELLLLD